MEGQCVGRLAFTRVRVRVMIVGGEVLPMSQIEIMDSYPGWMSPSLRDAYPDKFRLGAIAAWSTGPLASSRKITSTPTRLRMLPVAGGHGTVLVASRFLIRDVPILHFRSSPTAADVLQRDISPQDKGTVTSESQVHSSCHPRRNLV